MQETVRCLDTGIQELDRYMHNILFAEAEGGSAKC